jgi:sugar/nucleoside kinase (ribokinase family)
VGEEAGGCVVVIVAPDGARTMVTDRGAAPLLAASDVDGRWLEGAAWLHVTGYALAAEPMYGAATAAADAIRTRGGRVSVDLASRALVDAMGAAVVRERVAALRPALVLGTEPELESVADRALAPLVVVKRGADGAALVGSANASLPAEPARVLDTTGAGDALAGGLLAAMAAGADPVAALRTGLRQAARCVERAGAMPARGRRV